MLFGLEAVALRKRQETQREVAGGKMTRMGTWYIRGTVNVGCSGDKVSKARWRWFGQVQRMG